MKKVLLTGGAGFIGHHVIEYLLDNTDYDIVSLDRLDFSGNLNRINEIIKDRADKNRIKVVYHDLRAVISPQIADVIGDIDIILHVAAASHVTRSIKYPMEFVENNVIATVNLLEYARTINNLERFVYFSTDEVFGPAVSGYRFSEYDRFNPTNPYSASKAAGEAMCVSYQNTYKLPIYITHTMNVYGERQNPEKYIPMVLKKIANDETITVHYDSNTGKFGSRCYLHAKDVASALLFILKLENIKTDNKLAGICPKFNIAADKEYDNMEILNIITDGLSVEPKLEKVDPNIDRPGHDFSYAISGDYLRSLGWVPELTVEERLPLVAQWYMDNKNWLK
jgi:dTDP-glucose 4,6-dehydratase